MVHLVQFSLATTSLMSLLSLLARTSVCVLGMEGTVASMITQFHLITPGSGHSGSIKTKKPRGKRLCFPPLIYICSTWEKPKADWIFKAFALMGQWKGKNMKVWLTEWAASDWSLSSSHFLLEKPKMHAFFCVFLRTFYIVTNCGNYHSI